MADIKVVQFSTKPPLNDLPALLRNKADEIERGEYPGLTTLFLVMPVEGAYPRLFGWGDVEGKNHPVIQLSLVKHWLLTNEVSR